jgi:hypothetical protein
MVFHLNNCKNIFRPLFCHFLPNFAIFRPPIFSGHGQFFGASFDLFGWKFGHLATVLLSHKVLTNGHGHFGAILKEPVYTKTIFRNAGILKLNMTKCDTSHD